MSSGTLVIRSRARQDILRAAKWYEQCQGGLGTAFIKQVGATIQSIEDNSPLYPVAYRNLRRALLRRFPYAVFYLVEKSGVSVVAVFGCKQDQTHLKIR